MATNTLSMCGEGFFYTPSQHVGVWAFTNGLTEQFVISEDESIDSVFARFNTSLKALDEGYSSKNYVRKFLRALHPKWRAKLTKIEESKDLTSLSLDELIGNLKVHEMIIKKDSEIVKAKVERKSIALKATKESSDEECSNSGSEDEEYAISRDDKNGKGDRKCFRCGDPNHLIGECPKPPKDKNQRAFVGGSWSDSGEEDDEKVKDETCLVAHASSEVCSESSYFSDENSSIDDIALDNEYDKLCKMSLKIITKNKKLKATRNSLENELRELKDKLSTLEKNKGVDLDCAKCHVLKIENEKLKDESTRLNKFEKSTHCLNEMLSNQKPSGDKLGLGFNSFEASSSGTKEIKFVEYTFFPVLLLKTSEKEISTNNVITEYLVNISKRRAFWSLNEDILKITVLTTNTPYPSRKIRRIHQGRYGVSVPALTKDHKGNMINTPYPEKTNTSYWRYRRRRLRVGVALYIVMRIGGTNRSSPTQRSEGADFSYLSSKSVAKEYPYYFDDAKIDLYYELPPLLLCLQPIQPRAKSGYESPYVDIVGDTDSIAEHEFKEDLEASINVVPKSVFEHLELANLKETDMLVEMADMTKKARYEYNYGVIGEVMLKGEPSETVILESIDTLDSSDNVEEPEAEHDNAKQILNLGKIMSRWHVGYDAAYEKGEHGMLEQWMCFQDHERQSVDGNHMTFTDFLKVLDSFDIEADYGRTRDDPYSRKFDEYKKAFDNEIEQLANEYDLRIGKKGYVLDNVWEKCEKFHGDILYHGMMKDSRKKSDERVLDNTLPLGRANGSRFMGMIRKEMAKEGGAQRKT
ncbi:zf-CCHC domain-containing protein [Tanacetum coccineum]